MAEEIEAGVGRIEEVDKGFNFNVTLIDDFQSHLTTKAIPNAFRVNFKKHNYIINLA